MVIVFWVWGPMLRLPRTWEHMGVCKVLKVQGVGFGLGIYTRT